MGNQVLLGPLQPCQFSGYKPLCLGLGGLASYFPGMVFADFAFHLLKTLLAERFASQTPGASEFFELFLIEFLKAPPLHPALKLLPTGRCVALDAVLSQQSVGSQPLETML